MPVHVTTTMITPIERKRLAIQKQIDKWEDKLVVLQKACKHKHATKIPKGSTGSWDRDDYYWYECKCPECDLYWNEEQ